MIPKEIKNASRQAPEGFTLVEVMAIVAVLGVVALVAVSRVTSVVGEADRTACHVNRADIENQAQLYYRNEGGWPLGNLSDLGANGAYFPEGLPICPVDGSGYTFDSSTKRVIGHDH